MAGGGGISGVAVGVAAAGGLLILSSVRNTTVADTLRSIIQQGKTPTGGSEGPSLAAVSTGFADALRAGGVAVVASEAAGNVADSAARSAVVTLARAPLGKPYRWGAAGPDAFDCSGLVSYCLRKAGLDTRRRVTTEYLVWSGATTIPRAECSAGDLVCYVGHIGIAVSRTQMIHAPHAGSVVQVANIWGSPVIRRLKGT
jgi:peptidoglycan DL-endopeptidase CwlO